MKNIDIYDILLVELGYPMEKVDCVMINKHEDELLNLKNEIGILPSRDMFNLILKNDDHYMDEVICDLFPYYGDESASLMMEAHINGAVILQKGDYKVLKKIQDELREKDYKVIITKIEQRSD
ncbi:MAG: ATP-dependent Clp protease adaptor ClpS [Bacteroidales bacterium]|nr:ATP-dependent Clp protease adaptor ClpS [Bacteroidales bacterium]